ncbi:unnamed protein product, partial [Heterotrigona itama]
TSEDTRRAAFAEVLPSTSTEMESFLSTSKDAEAMVFTSIDVEPIPS